MHKAVVAAVVAALVLTACGGDDSGSDAAATADALKSAVSAAASTDSAPAVGADYGKATCQMVKGLLPALDQLDPAVMSKKTYFLGVYLEFVQQHSGKLPNDTELDEITTRECPEVRSDALKSLGLGSLTELI